MPDASLHLPRVQNTLWCRSPYATRVLLFSLVCTVAVLGPEHSRCPLLWAQVVQLFDSWAHHLSPEQFAEFSLPYAERVITAVRAVHPSVPLIYHANGGEPRRTQRSLSSQAHKHWQ